MTLEIANESLNKISATAKYDVHVRLIYWLRHLVSAVPLMFFLHMCIVGSFGTKIPPLHIIAKGYFGNVTAYI